MQVYLPRMIKRIFVSFEMGAVLELERQRDRVVRASNLKSGDPSATLPHSDVRYTKVSFLIFRIPFTFATNILYPYNLVDLNILFPDNP